MRDAATTTPDRWLLLAALTATAIVGVGGTAGVEVSSTRELSAAVLFDGFAVLDGTPNDRHVIQVDRDGGSPTRRAIPVIAPEARMIGTWAGVAIGWHDKGKIQFARVTGDGELGEVSTWGKGVTQLCDGTASDELRWGFGWLQKDGRVWLLHGQTKQTVSTLASTSDVTAAAAKTVWCGVTSAGSDIGLFWRDAAGKLFVNLCSQKSCSSRVTRIPFDPKQKLEGLACTAKSCLVAFRNDRGAQVGSITLPQGRVTWIKPLADATADTTFSLVAAGDQAFAIGYVSREGAIVSRVIASSSMVRAWADPYSQEVPALAWADDRLLVAHRHGDKVAPEVVPLPR
ncbi:hypothetical protein BH11MYX3_BH11MYX3_46020 [soil metagenome]